MTGRCKVVIAACLAGLVLVGVGTHRFLRFLLRVGVPRIVARAVSPDGVEMCIVQECNFSTEPFTTSFVYRKPGADWGWFYFDHEDWYWGTGRVSVDTSNQVAVFYRAGSPAATFAWGTETYTLHRWDRTLTGAQECLPTGWSPRQSVRSR